MKIMQTQAIGLCLVLLLAACTGGNNPRHEEANPNEYASMEDAEGSVQRMSVYDFTDTLRMGSHEYVYTIHREPADSLPTVTDDFGSVFADNIYSLTLRRDGTTYFSRSFTKNAFAHLLSSDMRRNGVLDGMMCDTTCTGFCFAVSVSQPQSDLFEPFLLTIDDQGGMTITRDTRLE